MSEPATAAQAGSDRRKIRALQAASGLLWTLVFAVAAVVLTALVDWTLAAALPEATFSRQVLALTCGTLLATLGLPRPRRMPRWSSVGLAWTPAGRRSGLLGLGVGVALAIVSVGAPWAAGAIEFERSAPDPGIWALGKTAALPSAMLLLVVAALGEELLTRGYGLQQLGRAVTPPGAALASGVFFGALHAGNPSADWVSVVNTCLFGLFFSFTVVRCRSLWPAFGMHLGWNLSLAVLGANISGLRMGLTALRAKPVGPPLWTGGDYGPEASLVATIAVLVAAVVVWKTPVPTDASLLIWDEVRPSEGGTDDS